MCFTARSIDEMLSVKWLDKLNEMLCVLQLDELNKMLCV